MSDIDYKGYQGMIADIATALEKTRGVMEQLELSDQARQAQEASSRLKSRVFSVGIMGEFKRGKSTVINALLGEEVAPADALPASATLNRVTYGLTPRATIVFKDGRREEVPVGNIAGYVTKITEESEAMAKSVDQAVVEYPCPFCQNNVDIIDTPGLNDEERMDAISEAVIPELDAVVMVISADAPFSRSEAEFLRGKLMTSEVTRMIFLVNRIDNIPENRRDAIVQHIRKSIVKELLERTAAVHGQDSQIYRDIESKLAGIHIYPTSAKQALTGRLENNQDLVRQSGILAFEDRLRRLLTQERGALEILRASAVISKLMQEGQSALELRRGALEMDDEQFRKSQQEAERELRDQRKKKVEETDRIKQKGRDIQAQIDGVVAEKYGDLETRLVDFVSAYPLTIAMVDDKEFPQKFQKELERETRMALSDCAEQINVWLGKEMEGEYLQLQEYMGDLSDSILKINRQISGDGASILNAVGLNALGNLAAVFATDMLSATGLGLMGLGGAIEGYRQDGVKGAIVGGAGGAVASFLTMTLLATSTPIVGIPFLLISGAAGAMGGRLLASLTGRSSIQARRVEEFRSKLAASAQGTVEVLRDKGLLEDWAKGQVKAQVDALVDHAERETESMISTTEETLTAIARDMASAAETKAQKKALYDHLQATLQKVGDTLAPIIERASAVRAVPEEAGV